MSLRAIQPQQAQRKSGGILGTLGALASLGGMAFGVPWLGALGMGMQGVDNILNGGSSMGTAQAATGAMNTVVNGLKDIWNNPSEGNIAKTEQQQAEEKIAKAVDNASTANGWDRYYKSPFPKGSNWINGWGSGLQPNGSWIMI